MSSSTISPISFNNLSKISFEVTEINPIQQEIKTNLLAPDQILAIGNLIGQKEPLPLTFKGKNNEICFLTTGKNVVSKDCTQIFGKSNLQQISEEKVREVQIEIGTILNEKKTQDPIFPSTKTADFFLSVDFGNRKIDVLLPDAKADLSLSGKQVAVITNLRRECVHDLPAHLLYFQNVSGENIPFSVSNETENGAHFQL